MTTRHPIQPLIVTPDGIVRFKENKIVSHLVHFSRFGGLSLNVLASMGFSDEDWMQFSQLIGYSLSEFGELSYVDDYTYSAAKTMYGEGLTEKDAKIAYLEEQLSALKQGLREPMAKLFGVHPDDLKV